MATPRVADRGHTRVHELTPAEARALLERAAQRYLQMSGEEFLTAWESGEFDDRVDEYPVRRVAMLLPLVR